MNNERGKNQRKYQLENEMFQIIRLQRFQITQQKRFHRAKFDQFLTS